MLYMVANHGKELARIALPGVELAIDAGRQVFLMLERKPKAPEGVMVVPMENQRQAKRARAKEVTRG
jgi:hypothetical protein